RRTDIAGRDDRRTCGEPGTPPTPARPSRGAATRRVRDRRRDRVGRLSRRARPACRSGVGPGASGYAPSVERQSNMHSPRLDEAMQHEVESLTRGAPIEARAEPEREMEGAGDGEPVAEPIVDEIEAPAGPSLSH